jgi:hypothetical protein
VSRWRVPKDWRPEVLTEHNGLASRIFPLVFVYKSLEGCNESSVTPSHQYLTAALKKKFHEYAELPNKSDPQPIGFPSL